MKDIQDIQFRSPSSIHNVVTPLRTIKDACAYLQCTPKYLERMVRAGRLRALKPSGKFLRFRQEDIDAFMDSGVTIGGEQ